jgi:hypothetical protein
MKLIISQYLASLRERDELDIILPDLLSELGLTVFSRPGRGTTQDGVDVAAVGSLNGEPEKIYLLSIKSGDLTRSTWSGDSHQALRPSLEDIIDAYIPNRLPVQHKNKEIVICLCFGGLINEQVRPKVEGFIARNTLENICFEEWNGDFIADLIMQGFLKEELLPIDARSMLRKSLALIDEPEYSYQHFCRLVYWLSNQETKNDKESLTLLRQLNICLWILFSWCRDANNLEPAYLASEITLLNAWEIAKSHRASNLKVSKSIMSTFSSCLRTYQTVTNEYLNKCVTPHVGRRHAISNAVNPMCKFDVNLKLFDLLSRLSIQGIWLSNEIRQNYDKSEIISDNLINNLHENFDAVKKLICNNPVLLSPYKDDQAIDIAIAIYSLSLDQSNMTFIKDWLKELIQRAQFSYEANGIFPSNTSDYSKLITLGERQTKEQKEELTKSSVLYPLISTVASLYKMEDISKAVGDFCEKSLSHGAMQYWYPLADTEDFLYTNKRKHGGVLHPIDLSGKDADRLERVFDECINSEYYNELSAVEDRLEPLIAVACRHYRYPLPMYFWLDDYKLFKEQLNSVEAAINS